MAAGRVVHLRSKPASSATRVRVQKPGSGTVLMWLLTPSRDVVCFMDDGRVMQCPRGTGSTENLRFWLESELVDRNWREFTLG